MTRVDPVRAVISDFGGVLTTPLIEGFAAYQRVSSVSVEQLGEAMQTIAGRNGDHPLFALERGELTEADFLRRLEAELGVPLEGFRATYFEHLHPNEPMIDYMRALRDRGLRMAMLTNNVREWEPLWRAKLPDIDEIFEVVVDSAFVGMRKPEPAIYALTLERLGGVAPQECVFLDDLEHNCEAARTAGMVAVRYESPEQAIAAMEAVISG